MTVEWGKVIRGGHYYAGPSWYCEDDTGLFIWQEDDDSEFVLVEYSETADNYLIMGALPTLKAAKVAYLLALSVKS